MWREGGKGYGVGRRVGEEQRVEGQEQVDNKCVFFFLNWFLFGFVLHSQSLRLFSSSFRFFPPLSSSSSSSSGLIEVKVLEVFS